MSRQPLICIDARLLEGSAGGIQQVVIGLAQGLSALEGPEAYAFAVVEGSAGWLEPWLKGPCKALPVKAPLMRSLAWARRQMPGWLLRHVHSDALLAFRKARLAASPGVAEAAGADLVHFIHQSAYVTTLPSIYQPHDLQHLHLPDFFSPREIEKRELLYRAYCQQAVYAPVMSHWGRRDLMAQYGLPGEKVPVVPWGSVVSNYPRPEESFLNGLRQRWALTEPFFLYPAQTWPHKNHLGLMQALKVMKDRQGRAPMVACPGGPRPHQAVVMAEAKRLGLGQNLRFLGYVSPAELRGLYHLATAMVFPSLFEGWGLPLTEAMAEGLPMACSTATCMPEQVGDAALLFDPQDPESMADAMQQILDNPALRQELAKRGGARVQRFDWQATARSFRALYRKALGLPLSDEDRDLLAKAFSSDPHGA
jgi:glycosyltransferase involved in cell wall biosynthesis